MCVFISCVVSTAVTIGTTAENNSSFKGRTTFLLLVDWWLKLSLYFRIVNYSQVHLSQQLLLQGCSRLASWNRGQRRFTVLDRPLSSGLSAERFCLLQISSRELNESLFVSLRVNCAVIVLFGCSWMTSSDIFNWKLKTYLHLTALMEMLKPNLDIVMFFLFPTRLLTLSRKLRLFYWRRSQLEKSVSNTQNPAAASEHGILWFQQIHLSVSHCLDRWLVSSTEM